MKKHIAITAGALAIALVAFAGSISYGPLNSTVITTSQVIVPEVKRVTNLWIISTAFTRGDYVRSSNKTYFALNSGTSTNDPLLAPNANDGDDTNDAAITWRYVRQRRDHIIIVNDSAGTIFLGFQGAETNKGIRLSANGGTYIATFPDAPQGEISAITLSGTNNVTIQEN